ncbi:MAG: DUF4350 domain-containing protein [Saprospiraceae bacterium]|nr:DUF4350 domain-containing protein [Saprospiraceae bacterium]
MQSHNRTPFLIAALAIVVLAGVFYYAYDSGKPRFEWRDSWSKQAYSENSDQPYGTEAFHRLLSGYFPEKKIVDIKKSLPDELPQDSSAGSIYLLVGEALYLDSAATAHLLGFVEAGNTAFIATKTLPAEIMSHLAYMECSDYEWNDYSSETDTFVRLSLREPHNVNPAETPMHFAVKNRPTYYVWHYIDEYYFCDSVPQFPIGYLNDTLINFTKCTFGKGCFLLHTNPLAFTNYSLLRPAAQSYAEGVLSWLPEGNIYWDASSRISEAVARHRNNSPPSRIFDEEHPLSYILQQRSLAWAWYLLAALAVVWLVFRAKRRQRIIPVLPKNENSSYEFISTIANLHFREKNYRGLCVQGMKLFLAQVRERYGMIVPIEQQTGLPRTDEEFFRRLAAVSEIPESQVRDIFTQYSATVQYQPTEEMMVNLHVATEAFWKKAK